MTAPAVEDAGTAVSGTEEDGPGPRLVGSIGVICHLIRPTVPECVELARIAEEAGADWCMMPDALGWRDVWITLATAAERTQRILLGPGATNPYTRHPFVTLAAIGTLDEISDGRAFLGVAAGGSELPAYAGIDRRDAPERLRSLVEALRRAASGDPPLPLVPAIRDMSVIGGARGRRMLEAVGDVCDVALLWAQTHGELERAANVVRGRRAVIAWSPLREVDGEGVRASLVYGVLNSREAVRRDLGIDADLERQIRDRLEQRGMDAAAALVTDAAMEAFLAPDDPAEAAATARMLGASVVAVQGFDVRRLPDRVAWAREVAHSLGGGEST